MRRIPLLAISILVVAAAASAAPKLTLDPANGALAGEPGQTVGWGFTLVNSTSDYLSVTGTSLLNETNPSLGTYEDFIGTEGGIFAGSTFPGLSWKQAFDPVNARGLGEYILPSSAIPGQSDSGIFLVQYDLFSGDPSLCGSCYVASSTLEAPFRVAVPAPEPGSFGLLLIAVAMGLARLRRVLIANS